PAKECTRIFDRDPVYKKLYEKSPPDSCFLLGNNAALGGRQSLDIILKDDAAAIRHGLVRQFGFIYSQLFLRMNFVGTNGMQNAYSLNTSEPASVTALKGTLAEAYMRD